MGAVSVAARGFNVQPRLAGGTTPRPVTDDQPAALLRVIARALDQHAIPYMVVGSFASTLHGEPRTTQDLDLVIDPTRESLDAFVAALDPAQFYVDADTARDAFRRRSMFNVIEMATAW